MNGYIDRGEVDRCLAGAHEATRTKFLDAVLGEGAPYFDTHKEFQKWLKTHSIPATTFKEDLVVSLW